MQPVVPQTAPVVPSSELAAIDCGVLLMDVGFAAFVWDIATDAINWVMQPSAVFADIPAHLLGTGAGLSRLIEPARNVRNEALAAARHEAAGRYQIEYGIRASKSANLDWIEETGHWSTAADGRVMVRGVVRINNARHEREQTLEDLARLDPLTGELNRLHLLMSLTETIEEALQFRLPSVFMLVGVDHLSRINESFGFDVADELICEVSRRIRARLRGGDVLGRFSGNKLGVILKSCSVDDAQIAAARFLKGIRDDAIVTKSGPVSTTVSIGAVNLPRYGRNVAEVTGRAQEAFNLVKRRRHGSYAMWRPSVEREALRRTSMRTIDTVVTALNEGRINLAFEPVVNAASRQNEFYECLVRVRQPDGELLTAPDIVPVAERLGMIRLVDHRVLELAVAELTSTRDLQLSLNISPESTMDPDWWSFIETMMQNNPGVAERLIVEITETVAIQDLDDVRGFVSRVKNLGARIAIDDFGAGYTSFSSLRKLDVDIVKIDGAFVQHIARSADDRAFVQTMIDLCRRLKIKTVAEWVQDDVSAALLESWGCDYIQGHLIGLASTARPWSATNVASRPTPT